MWPWQPRYDLGAGQHIPDPTDEAACLCGHRWDRPPTVAEWQEHKYGPDDAEAFGG